MRFGQDSKGKACVCSMWYQLGSTIQFKSKMAYSHDWKAGAIYLMIDQLSLRACGPSISLQADWASLQHGAWISRTRVLRARDRRIWHYGDAVLGVS